MSIITLPDLVRPEKLKPPNSGPTLLLGIEERGESKGDVDNVTVALGSKNRAIKAYSAVALSMRTRRRERNTPSIGSFYLSLLARWNRNHISNASHVIYHPPYKRE
jgi:hypothetical protein